MIILLETLDPGWPGLSRLFQGKFWVHWLSIVGTVSGRPCFLIPMFANYSDISCAFLRLSRSPHPAFGTPLPNGRGDRG
jgi:hypothetical protein